MRKPRTILRPDAKAYIRERYLAGDSPADLAAKFGITEATVHNQCKEDRAKRVAAQLRSGSLQASLNA